MKIIPGGFADKEGIKLSANAEVMKTVDTITDEDVEQAITGMPKCTEKCGHWKRFGICHGPIGCPR